MSDTSTRFLRWLCVGLLLAGVLSACGQKGDLYHPEEEEEAAAPVIHRLA